MKKIRLNMFFAVLLLTTASFLLQARAQSTVGAEQKVIASGNTGTGGEVRTLTLGAMLRQGGWTMWPLGFFSAAMLFFIVRNAMLLREKDLLRADLAPEIEGLLSVRNLKGVREVCRNNPSLMTSVLDAGLERISENDLDPVHITEAIEEAGNEQLVIFMRPINYLSIIGSTAPMLGLLGTVSGMIKAFQNISAGGMGKPELLAGNIGEALITTAVGLIIAIPSMICYFIYKNNFIKHMSSMERMISHFLSVYRNGKLQ